MKILDIESVGQRKEAWSMFMRRRGSSPPIG